MSEKPTLNREFVVSLKGKDHPMYRGVLDLAHQMELESLKTRLLQAPSDENGHTAIVEAEVRLKDGRVFTDIGDASPTNVPPMIKEHIIRMASTRAKGRALRDAVNVGEALIEEIDEEAPAGPPARVAQGAPAAAPRPAAAAPAAPAPPANGNGNGQGKPAGCTCLSKSHAPQNARCALNGGGK
jgi:hypothetical protein